MSRHYIEHNNTHGITVGWDRLLGTFFAQVEALETTDDLEEELLIDIGSPFDTIYPEIDAFAKALLEKLSEIGITDFELSQQQKFQLLDDMNGIGS